MDPKPKAFFKAQGIKFDGLLFIRYRVEQTFQPLTAAEIKAAEKNIGATLPSDYKTLLQMFGGFHLPGRAGIQLRPPLEAMSATSNQWQDKTSPLRVIAISQFNQTSDGDCIGFLRKGKSFLPELFKFDHERVYQGTDPSLWSKKVGDSLSEFLLSYLNRGD